MATTVMAAMPAMCGSMLGMVRAWVQRGSDIDGEAAGDLSGCSVSLSADGSVVAIGAHGNDGNGIDSGHVRLYAWNGSSWVQRGSDIDGEAAGDQSGWSVSLSADGSVVAIGAHLNDGNGIDSGHVRLYAWNGSSWVQRGSDIDGEAAGDLSGWSVSLSADGSVVAIGTPYNSNNGGLAGHVRVYQLQPDLPDFDNDGLPDETDLDDDNDGVSDAQDFAPLDSTEAYDFDEDGLGDNADPDDDNDNILDVDDILPFRSSADIQPLAINEGDLPESLIRYVPSAGLVDLIDIATGYGTGELRFLPGGVYESVLVEKRTGSWTLADNVLEVDVLAQDYSSVFGT